MIRGLVHGRIVYAVYRNDGVVIVGASSDESAEREIESGVVRRLLEDVTTLIPSLDRASFLEARVGLRPASSTHNPFFERIDNGPWAWSNGYFRHGYLMAPLAAQLAANFVEEN